MPLFYLEEQASKMSLAKLALKPVYVLQLFCSVILAEKAEPMEYSKGLMPVQHKEHSNACAPGCAYLLEE